MSSERTIATPAPSDLPTFTIRVNDEALPREYHVLGVVVVQMINRIAWAKVILRDGDPAAQDFPAGNSDRFVPGNTIRIDGGYHSQESPLFHGIIVRHGIRTRQGKPSMLTIECRHVAFKMTLSRKSAYFYDTTDSDVFTQLIDAYGIDHQVESTSTQHPALVQYACTDWDFLINRAETNGLVVLTNDETVAVKPPDFSAEPSLSLQYGATVLELEAQMDARDQLAALTCGSWNPAEQSWQTAEAQEPAAIEQGNLDAATLARVNGEQAPVNVHGGQVSADELQAWADAGLLKSRMARIQGRAKCIGFSGIQAGDMLGLEGMGDRFNGHAFVSGVRHEFGGGTWTTEVQFGGQADWHAATHDVAQPAASALIPPVGGLQIGIVTALEGDPAGEERIQVRMPLIDAGEDGVWARIACLDAGENRGSVFRPEIDDEVVLGFINDDPRDAVVLGMLHSSARPAPIAASDDNHEKGFVTRSGLSVVFNDDLVSFTIATPNGNTVVLSDDEGGISLSDESGNTLTMSSDGIAIESAADINIKATGDLNLEGTNTNAKASAQFKAEGSAGVEMSSSATAVLRGSMVQIN
jgi:Rhs element Vgr protein